MSAYSGSIADMARIAAARPGSRMTQLGHWPLPGSDLSARFEIILPPVLPVGECRSGGLARPRTPQGQAPWTPPSRTAPPPPLTQVQKGSDSRPTPRPPPRAETSPFQSPLPDRGGLAIF